MRWQAGWCTQLGSPLNGQILEAAATLLERDGSGGLTALLETWTEEPTAAALALRIAGALQALVRMGHADHLAPYYDNPFAAHDQGVLAAAIADTVVANRAYIADFLTRPVQTNELGRSACLLGGFLAVAEATQMPLRLLEIGTSCGLNLLWDRFHYDLTGLTWGPQESPVRLFIKWRGGPPALGAPVSVAERRGCDINPLDVTRDEDLIRAESYIFPGQIERLARFRAGVALARKTPLHLDRADAADWLLDQLARPTPDQCTVVFHSIMWQYMPLDTQKRCMQIIADAGDRAHAGAPLAWLRMEPAQAHGMPIPEIRLVLWPGGMSQRLALCHPHGADIEWRPDPPDQTAGS